MKLRLLFILVLMLAVALFSLQNAAVITVRFALWQFAISQALLILLAVVFGVLIGLAVGLLAGRATRDTPTAPVAPPAPTTDRKDRV